MMGICLKHNKLSQYSWISLIRPFELGSVMSDYRNRLELSRKIYCNVTKCYIYVQLFEGVLFLDKNIQ